MNPDYAEHEYVARVGEHHPALIVIGKGYDRETAPTLEDVRTALEDAEWELSHVYDMDEGPVEVQHEHPPTDPYDAWGVVVVLEQSPTQLEYGWNGPFCEAIEAIDSELDGIEIWIDAV